jgi:hypothetical protein
VQLRAYNFRNELNWVVARGGSEPPTRGFSVALGQLQFLQKRLVAWIADKPAHESVALDLQYAPVALVIGALEPFER